MRSQNKHLKPFKKGHKKVGGVKLGFKSLKVELEDALKGLTMAKDGKKISYQVALVNKLIHKAIIEGDMQAMKLIWEYIAGKPVTPIDMTSGGEPIPLLDLYAIRKDNSNSKDSETNKKD